MTTDFAVRTTDSGWIKRNAAKIDSEGRAHVTVAGVERVRFAGVDMLRHVFTDVPDDFPNGAVLCPAAWVVGG